MTSNFNHGGGRLFYLVESRDCPNNREGFKMELRDDETFQTEFIGATEQECQNWELEHQFQHNFIEQDIIAIAEARSATDNTVLVQFYSRELEPPEPLEFGVYGVFPHEHSIW
jgi:hypothetical protein